MGGHESAHVRWSEPRQASTAERGPGKGKILESPPNGKCPARGSGPRAPRLGLARGSGHPGSGHPGFGHPGSGRSATRLV